MHPQSMTGKKKIMMYPLGRNYSLYKNSLKITNYEIKNHKIKKLRNHFFINILNF